MKIFSTLLIMAKHIGLLFAIYWRWFFLHGAKIFEKHSTIRNDSFFNEGGSPTLFLIDPRNSVAVNSSSNSIDQG